MSINVKSLVSASAEIITVVHMNVGDVYMRLDTDGSDYNQLLYGVVTAVYNNGTDTVITAVEYGKQRYSTNYTTMHKVFQSNNSPKIFAADPKDFKNYFNEMLQSVTEEARQAESTLQDVKNKLREIQSIGGYEQLSQPETIKGIEAVGTPDGE